MSRINQHIPVVFINTGFHFPVTLSFRDEIVPLFGFSNIIDLRSQVPKSLQKDQSGRFLYASDPDYCCYLNKTQPINNLLRSYDIWISGVRADQSPVRSWLQKEQKAPHDNVRFHPMLDWTNKMIGEYKAEYDLPVHPLEGKGFSSIDCQPCTRITVEKMGEREVRWFGLNKTECGLHTDLIER